MGCKCSCTNKEASSEMIADSPFNDNNEEIMKENEKGKQSQRTSVQSQLNASNIIEIKDIEKEKPKLIEKLSKEGMFLEKNISEIIEEQNPEANKINVENEITIEHANNIELPSIQLNNGEIYGGGWNLQGKKEGYGVSIDNNNNVYKGLWKNNNYGDYGCFIHNNGDYYKGKLINGKANGKGEMLINNKLKYTGNFDNELPNGEGTIIDYENETNYSGHILNGAKDGYGILEFNDGTKYEGEFKNDNYEGKGKIIYSDGSQYEGDFKNNMKDGKGIFTWPDGKVYEGDYVKNIKNGKGKLILEENKFYEGNWINDQPHGKGLYNINGEILSGIFRYGKIIIVENAN